MKDVLVKAKSKLGKIPDNDLYMSLANETNLDRKIEILAKAYPDYYTNTDKRDIESNNFINMYQELKSIDYFLHGLDSKFFNLYFSKYEILFLQEIIESLVNENYEKNYLHFKANPLSDNFILEPDMDLARFVNQNQDSRYYRVLLAFINKNMEEDSLIFLSSNALMKFYFRSLLKLARKFPRKERANIENFIGEEINLSNFEILYRLKSFYDLEDKDIFNYLIEGGNTFNGPRLKEISLLSRDDFLKRMRNSKYARVFTDDNNVHIGIRRYQHKLYRSEITKEETDILFVISAMNLIFISGENIDAMLEVDDSFTIDERIQYLIVR